MSDNYDSILKEKKVYEDYTPTHPVFKKFMLLAIFLSLVIIVVSYVVYYNTFLNGETVFVNNVVRLIDNYSIISYLDNPIVIFKDYEQLKITEIRLFEDFIGEEDAPYFTIDDIKTPFLNFCKSPLYS